MILISYIPTTTGSNNGYTIILSGTGIGETIDIKALLPNPPAVSIANYTTTPNETAASVAAGIYATLNPAYQDNITGVFINILIPGTLSNILTTYPNTATTTASGIYNVRYKFEFDPREGPATFFKPRYRLEILQKNYTGTPNNVTGGIVIHSWSKDEAKPAVKGSSVNFSIITKTLPLTTFYSVNDDEFKVRIWFTDVGLLARPNDNLLFEGFLVQDDCSEMMVDYTHELNLSATDNLGLLKDVTLDKAPGGFAYFNGGTETLMATAPNLLRIGIGLGRQVNKDDKIEIIGTSIAGTYSISSMVENGLYLDITTVEPLGTLGPTSTTINILRNNLLEKITLSNFIKRCLSATLLELNTYVYCNLFESNNVTTTSFLDQVLIDPQSFNKGNEEYEDCYTILDQLLDRFNLTLFQANGVWNLVRLDELRYYSNLIPGYAYDTDFNLISTITLPPPLDVDIYDANNPPLSYPENGLINKIFRPDILVKEKFDYKQPEQMLRNNNLQTLGSLINKYTEGSGVNLKKISEYKFPWWYDAKTVSFGVTTTANYFIRVVHDHLDNEIERYAVVKNGDIKSYKIEVDKGDIFNYSFSFRTKDSFKGTAYFRITITDGTSTKIFEGDPVTIVAPGISVTAGGWVNSSNGVKFKNGDTKEWQTVTIVGSPFPFNGHLFVHLQSIAYQFPDGLRSLETYYKDLRFEHTAFINESTKIIGHTHKSEQDVTAKQKEEEKIYVDDSPRNFISGALFINQLNGIIQKRTSQWKRNHIPLEKRKLGNITTFEQLFWKRTARTILEGSFRGLLHNNDHTHISMSSIINYLPKADLNFVFGKLEIDYKNSRFTGTLHEMYATGEADADLNSEYEFKYQYETQ